MLLPTKRTSHVIFRLQDLNLTLAYSKGHLGSCNGVLPNIVRLCRANKRLDLEVSICTYICILIRYVCPPVFIQIITRTSPSVSRFKIRMEYTGKCVSLQAYRHCCDVYGADGRYRSPRLQGRQEMRWTTFRQHMSRGGSL